MSRILNKIQAELDRESSTHRTSWLLVRRAIHLAQKGEIEAAKRDIETIRRAFASSYEPSGVALVNIAEAAVLYQEAKNEFAIDKARRSLVLSKSVRDDVCASASAAWLAHLYFNQRRYSDAISSAAEALSYASVDEPWINSRLAMTIGYMLHFFGDYANARPWYTKARMAAVDEGDDAMIGSLLYNTSVLRLNNFRIAEIEGSGLALKESMLDLEIESSANFDRGIGSVSFPNLIPFAVFQLHAIRGRYKEAIDVFDELIRVGGLVGLDGLPLYLQADYVWCLTCIGRERDALPLCESFPQGLDDRIAWDEQAMMFARLSEVFRRCRLDSSAAKASENCEAALARYSRIRAELLPIMQGFFSIENISPGRS